MYGCVLDVHCMHRQTGAYVLQICLSTYTSDPSIINHVTLHYNTQPKSNNNYKQKKNHSWGPLGYPGEERRKGGETAKAGPERVTHTGGPAGRKHTSTRRKRNEDGFPE